MYFLSKCTSTWIKWYKTIKSGAGKQIVNSGWNSKQQPGTGEEVVNSVQNYKKQPGTGEEVVNSVQNSNNSQVQENRL
jgi:hypothetical protein